MSGKRQVDATRPTGPRGLNSKQSTYLNSLNRCDTVVVQGPAGTGKTYLACAYAAHRLHDQRTSRVVLTRPMVGISGRTMGYLPGKVADKLEPWARPLVEVFKRHASAKWYDDVIKSKALEIVALEHVRGLTFDNAILIIDEAQNATPQEMKAFLTRIGQDAQVIIIGDTTQSDLMSENGLSWVVAACDRGLVPGAALVSFGHADIVRSKRCADWVRAFSILEREKRHGSREPERSC